MSTMDSVDQPNSLCHIKSTHMYSLPPMDVTSVPFCLLTGEAVLHSGTSVDGPILLTNYRLYLQARETHYHIPVGLIEIVENKDLFYLNVGCKDARTYKCTFENNEKCLEWYDRIQKAADPPKQLDQLFAFYHCIWSMEKGGDEVLIRLENQRNCFDRAMFEKEMSRLQFQGHSWRISKVNENYKFCPTYPPYLLVPSCINDDMLESVAKYRSSRRIPAVVWRHTGNGAVIVRCSQPEVGWLGWRSSEDEDLLKAISDACSFDGNFRMNYDRDSNISCSPDSHQSDESVQITNHTPQNKKLLIMDARSYGSAVANRARGGGCECAEYYDNCEIQFMSLANIHSIRKSFHGLRVLCSSSPEQPTWLSQLENTRWLVHMAGVMKAATTLVAAVERDGRPVLVHCSDGWDRTPQIVALAELMLDPYYRTFEGFRVLIEREWLAFGHKFADRCGQSSGSDDPNERCPVFLQWLDCVHQLSSQFPCAFEFSQSYLVKLVQHTYSNLFGTFLCNTQQQRMKSVFGKTFSIWDFLSSPCFRNHLYANVNSSCWQKVLWPKCNVRDMKLWTDVYLGSESTYNADGKSDVQSNFSEPSNHYMTKTRSYGDLINEGAYMNHYNRRCSDPSINCESKIHINPKDTNHISENSDIKYRKVENVPSNGFPTELEDGDCNQDCIFKDDPKNLDDQIARIEQLDFGDPPQLMAEETIEPDVRRVEEVEEEEEDVATETTRNGETTLYFFRENGLTSETRLQNGIAAVKNVIESEIDNLPNSVVCATSDSGRTVQNGDAACRMVDEPDSPWDSHKRDSRERQFSESLFESDAFLGIEKTIETSTETIIADAPSQNCKIDRRTRCCSENSMNGWDNMFHVTQKKIFYVPQHPLGEDGLVALRSPVQERLNQIEEEYQKKIASLEKELHIARQSLIRQSCHRCNQTDSERQDDNCSVAESQTSTSEGGAASVGESYRSDMSSWVAVDEGPLPVECQTLWVPDYAVNRCTGCSTEFWMGRRKHHCRKCGKIFCADCSENRTRLPSEQLFSPVRVCTNCYTDLQRNCGGEDMPKHHANTQPLNTSPRIAASSN